MTDDEKAMLALGASILTLGILAFAFRGDDGAPDDRPHREVRNG